MDSNIEIIYCDYKQVSPGGQCAFGVKVDGHVLTACIGSADNFRDAKACALRHLREAMKQLQKFPGTN